MIFILFFKDSDVLFAYSGFSIIEWLGFCSRCKAWKTRHFPSSFWNAVYLIGAPPISSDFDRSSLGLHLNSKPCRNFLNMNINNRRTGMT
jgi:hypothetical protein